MYAKKGGCVIGVVYKDAEFGGGLVGEVESAKRVSGEVVFNDIISVKTYITCAFDSPTVCAITYSVGEDCCFVCYVLGDIVRKKQSTHPVYLQGAMNIQ